MRKIEITDAKILNLLNSKAEISKRQLDMLKQQEELEKEFNKNVSIHARVDEKVRPLIKKITDKIEFEEFEQVSRVGQDEKDKKWYIEIADRLAEFRLRFKQEKEKLEKDGNK